MISPSESQAPEQKKECPHKRREYIEFIDSPLGGRHSFNCLDCGETVTHNG